MNFWQCPTFECEAYWSHSHQFSCSINLQNRKRNNETMKCEKNRRNLKKIKKLKWFIQIQSHFFKFGERWIHNNKFIVSINNCEHTRIFSSASLMLVLPNALPMSNIKWLATSTSSFLFWKGKFSFTNVKISTESVCVLNNKNRSFDNFKKKEKIQRQCQWSPINKLNLSPNEEKRNVYPKSAKVWILLKVLKCLFYFSFNFLVICWKRIWNFNNEFVGCTVSCDIDKTQHEGKWRYNTSVNQRHWENITERKTTNDIHNEIFRGREPLSVIFVEDDECKLVES